VNFIEQEQRWTEKRAAGPAARHEGALLVAAAGEEVGYPERLRLPVSPPHRTDLRGHREVVVAGGDNIHRDCGVITPGLRALYPPKLGVCLLGSRRQAASTPPHPRPQGLRLQYAPSGVNEKIGLSGPLSGDLARQIHRHLSGWTGQSETRGTTLL
jgi:hypothetical protein